MGTDPDRRLALRAPAERDERFTEAAAASLVGTIQNPRFTAGWEGLDGRYRVASAEVLDDGAALWVVMDFIGDAS